MSELKPCPFCENTHFQQDDGYVRNPHFSYYRNDDMLVNAEVWNTRPVESALQQQVAELTEQVKAANEDAERFYVWSTEKGEDWDKLGEICDLHTARIAGGEG
jgi:hypothetical protein